VWDPARRTRGRPGLQSERKEVCFCKFTSSVISAGKVSKVTFGIVESEEPRGISEQSGACIPS
ncbi:5320_t:CDS:1, partial [Scutellospora calospora]